MRTTLTRLLCLVWLCLAYSPAHAQTETPSSTTDSLPTRYRWEVATDLLWLLDKHTMPATSIFIRRHTEKGAWRLRVGGSYKRKIYEPLPHPQSTIPASKFINDERAYTFLLRGGYEFQKMFRKNIFYYGGDINISYSIEKANNYYSLQQQIGLQGYNDKISSNNSTIGLVLFLGIKRYIIPKLSISGEAGFSCFYDYINYEKNTYETPIDDLSSLTGSFYTQGVFQVNIQPLYVFNLSYHF